MSQIIAITCKSHCQCSTKTTSIGKYKEILKLANEQLGGSWRLPRRDELEGLLCTSCGPPLIDAEVFPGTSGEPYWTGQGNKIARRFYYSVNFLNGWTFGRFLPSKQLAVRLVRDRN